MSTKESIVKEKVSELKSMISELKEFDKMVLKKVKCELIDPSYKKFILFDIYEIGIKGILKFEYNEGYSSEADHIYYPEILEQLRCEINNLLDTVKFKYLRIKKF